MPLLDVNFTQDKPHMVDHSSCPIKPPMPENINSQGPTGLNRFKFPLHRGAEILLTRDMTQTGYAIGLADSRHAVQFLHPSDDESLKGKSLLRWNTLKGDKVGCLQGPLRGGAGATALSKQWLDPVQLGAQQTPQQQQPPPKKYQPPPPPQMASFENNHFGRQRVWLDRPADG